MRCTRRLLCAGFEEPAHLKQTFYTPLTNSRCMIVGRPFWRYPLAVVPPQPDVSPLITAIRDLPSTSRPFRIVSHEDASGRVFNASVFDDAPTMQNFLEWYGEHALDATGAYHHCLKAPAADEVPTRATLLFSAGNTVLADTRFGEYQLGMAVRYSRYTLRSAEARAEVEVAAASGEFEARIAACMQEHGLAYFGRLIMSGGDEAGGGHLLTAVRYGTLADAERGTALSRELLRSELESWFVDAFSGETTIMGTASRVLEL